MVSHRYRHFGPKVVRVPPKATKTREGCPNKDPDAIWKSKSMELGIKLNMQDRKRLEWVCKYFDLKHKASTFKFALNMVFEIMLAHEKGFEIYMERKFAKKIYRRRIIIE